MPTSPAAWTSTATPERASRNSRTLPGLALATTSWMRRLVIGRTSAELRAGHVGHPARRRDPVGDERHVPFGVERTALAAPLDLDDLAGPGGHDVEVDLGLGVLGVVEIDGHLAGDDADADGRELVPQRPLVELALEDQPVGGVVERGIARDDRGAARAAIGQQHVHVDDERLLPEQVEVDGAA